MFNRFEKPSYDELRNILSYLSYSDRDQWYKTFAIVGREYGQDPTAFDICQDWASKYSGRKTKDKDKERDEFFKSSKRNGPTIGALIKEAKLHGYQPPKVHKDSVHAHKAPESALDLFQVLSHTQPPATPQDDALEGLYALSYGSSRAALKFWVMNEEVAPTVRASFMRRYQKGFESLPVEVSKYFNIVSEFAQAHRLYSYDAFMDWADYTFKNFNREDAQTYFAESEMAANEEAACEHIERAITAGWRIALTQRHAVLGKLLKEEKDAKRVEKALATFAEASKPFNPLLPALTGHNIPDTGRRIVSEIVDPTLCAKYYQATNYHAIDKYIYGWRRGEVSIMAAHSGVGKTWFGADASRQVIENGGHVLFITTEMSKDAIGERVFCNVGQMSISQAMTARENGELEELLREVSKKNTETFKDDSSLHVVYADKLSEVVGAIDSRCDFMAVDLVVVDYLQNIFNDEADHKRTANWERVNATMNALTKAAERNKCPILVLAQLNNPNNKTGNNKEPNLYDIADASGVVRDAAAVLMMYRVEVSGEGGMTELRAKIVKSRYGSIPERHLTVTRASGSRFTFTE